MRETYVISVDCCGPQVDLRRYEKHGMYVYDERFGIEAAGVGFTLMLNVLIIVAMTL